MRSDELAKSVSRRLETIRQDGEDFTILGDIVGILCDTACGLAPELVDTAPLSVRSLIIMNVLKYDSEVQELPELPPERMFTEFSDRLLRWKRSFAEERTGKNSLTSWYKYMKGLVRPLIRAIKSRV